MVDDKLGRWLEKHEAEIIIFYEDKMYHAELLVGTQVESKWDSEGDTALSALYELTALMMLEIEL